MIPISTIFNDPRCQRWVRRTKAIFNDPQRCLVPAIVENFSHHCNDSHPLFTILGPGISLARRQSILDDPQRALLTKILRPTETHFQRSSTILGVSVPPGQRYSFQQSSTIPGTNDRLIVSHFQRSLVTTGSFARKMVILNDPTNLDDPRVQRSSGPTVVNFSMVGTIDPPSKRKHFSVFP